jgi:hypothetical protein
MKTVPGPAPRGPRQVNTISTGATINMNENTQSIQRADFILSSKFQIDPRLKHCSIIMGWLLKVNRKEPFLAWRWMHDEKGAYFRKRLVSC